jgi:penicillin-binding protein 1C
MLVLVLWAVFTPLPPELSAESRAGAYGESVRYLDRDGALLREVRADDATRARWIDLDDVPDHAKVALLAAEDRRFFSHPGVDPFAVVRAIVSSAAQGRIVSGASTLTMQLARLVRPHRKNLLGKLGEMALALRIEASLSKREIMTEYVNRAPFGPSIRGLDAASRYWFDKSPRQLTLAEAAALAGLPRGPAVYDPTKHPERVVRRRDRILDRMRSAGWISAEEAEQAKKEPFAIRAPKGSFGAPHFVQALSNGAFGSGASARTEVRTTLTRDLQREAEGAVVSLLAPLAARHVTAGSVVVLDNASGEILAYVGSPSFQDTAHGGQNDGVRAKRQPGSTLKPFVYGLAMERLGYTPATVLPDVELHLPVADGAVYAPMNYDERFHGPVRLREALANSLNVPAVWTATNVGVGPLLERLRDLGLTSLTEEPEWYGPGLALGDGEITLLELANAYATLARGGLWKPVRAVLEAGRDKMEGKDAHEAEERRVMPRETALALTDILADRGARVSAFGKISALDLPFPVAAKTGTSKGYRDNWTVGYTREVTVAVWVGNFDASPMQDVSGITGAGPLFHAVMAAAMRGRAPAPLRIRDDDEAFVEVNVCPLSGGRPTAVCPHTTHEKLPRDAAEHLAPCTMHERARVDTRNGLRAGEHCPASFVDERTYERFAPPFTAWAESARREVAPAVFSPLCPMGPGDRSSPGAASAVRIAYPHDGARFVIDPGRSRAEQTLGVRVEVPSGAGPVELRVDGRTLAKGQGGMTVQWPLTPGPHVFVAEMGTAGRSESVEVRVE